MNGSAKLLLFVKKVNNTIDIPFTCPSMGWSGCLFAQSIINQLKSKKNTKLEFKVIQLVAI